MSEFDADKALETARDSVSGFGFDLPEDKFALTTENVELRTRLEKAEKERDELKAKLEAEEKLHYYKDQAYKMVKEDNEDLKSSKNYLARLVKKLEKEQGE